MNLVPFILFLVIGILINTPIHRGEIDRKVRRNRFSGFPVFTYFTYLTYLTFLTFFATAATAASVVNSKHNLSSTGPGTVKAATETDVCLFCHTVHRTTGQTPLWSHGMSSVSNYVVYSSATLKATVGQPDGSSRLCLSCHDGTVALGMVSSRTSTIEMQKGITTLPLGPSNLGTDLSGDHPISFVYDRMLAGQDPGIKDPATINHKLKLDHFRKMQCVTCHNPHDDQFGNFLVMDNTGSTMCLSCHNEPGWTASTHASSTATFLTSTTAPTKNTRTKQVAKTIAAGGCGNCHTSHKAGSRARLLVHEKEEQNCFVCHNGTIVNKDLRSEFTKSSVHPVLQTSSEHSILENPINHPRHTACSDCHDSHNVRSKAVSRTALAATSGIKGVNSAGAIVNARREYELCFRCHSESPNRGPTRVTRQFPESNKRLQFQLSNRSFHPIESVGKNPNVPSLIAPWTTASLMECTDCHNNDQGTKAGGAGPDGPHGSAFTPILERQLMLSDGNVESPGNYALCYKCHSRSSILADQSFKATSSQSDSLGQARGHQFHVVSAKAACTTCHDSHGVEQQPHLINFNRDYVTPSSTGRLQYISSGNSRGACSLTCHGFDHDNTSYPFSSLGTINRHGKHRLR
jgi:predicted CXXCH cytochrome family protein